MWFYNCAEAVISSLDSPLLPPALQSRTLSPACCKSGTHATAERAPKQRCWKKLRPSYLKTVPCWLQESFRDLESFVLYLNGWHSVHLTCCNTVTLRLTKTPGLHFYHKFWLLFSYDVSVLFIITAATAYQLSTEAQVHCLNPYNTYMWCVFPHKHKYTW